MTMASNQLKTKINFVIFGGLIILLATCNELGGKSFATFIILLVLLYGREEM